MISKLICVVLVAIAADHRASSDHSTAIDSVLDARFASEGLSPQPVCDDLTFLRRVSLDLLGRIPTIDEIESFQQHPDRRQVIEQMLQSEEFDRFLAQTWTAWLLGYSNAFNTDREMFRIWMEKQIRADRSFREIVRAIIVARGSVATEGEANFLARHRYDPAVAISRSFLGVRLECAQCHDHPFDRWTEEDYHRMRRFFSTMDLNERDGAVYLSDRNGNDQGDNRPRFLTGSIPATDRYREELALYVINCKPFERTFANRAWYQLMGRGIVDPPDDHHKENSPSDLQLFEQLTAISVETDLKIKPMFRAICNTQAYQRETAKPQTSPKEIQLFAARTIKPLLPEQFSNSLARIIEMPDERRQRRDLVRQLVGQPDLNEDHQRTWQYRETVQQLMEKISIDLGQRDLSFRTAESIDELYMRILTRKPTDAERIICADRSRADVMFALIFGNEFFFNH